MVVPAHNSLPAPTAASPLAVSGRHQWRSSTARSRFLTHATLTVMVVISVTACGAERPQKADTIAEVSSAAASSAAEKRPSGGSATLTSAQAKAALLRVSDLPTGWSTSEDKNDDSSSKDKTEPAQCEKLLKALSKQADPIVKASASFTGSSLGSFLEQNVNSFKDDVEPQLEEARAAFNRCPRFTQVDAKGERTQFRLAPLSFPNLGDRTLALRVSGKAEGFNVTLDVVYVALGHNGVSIMAGGLAPMAADDLEATARKAVDRLRSAS